MLDEVGRLGGGWVVVVEVHFRGSLALAHHNRAHLFLSDPGIPGPIYGSSFL